MVFSSSSDSRKGAAGEEGFLTQKLLPIRCGRERDIQSVTSMARHKIYALDMTIPGQDHNNKKTNNL
jgi:hypothetical protein